MTRWNLGKIDQKVLIREKLSQFYTSYKYQLDSLLSFAEEEIKGRLVDIENFFSADLGVNNREFKKKRFDVPLPYSSYVEFKSRRKIFFRNREFKLALKRVGAIYQRQWFRNKEIFSTMEKCLSTYYFVFRRNQHLKDLCRANGYAGLQARMFKRRRLEECRILMKEFRRMRKGSGKEVCVNRIEDYIKMYSDFFVQCQFKLDKFREGIDRFLTEDKNEALRKMSSRSTEEMTEELEFPSWNLANTK